jgi:cbb3-type cytochrome oxidase subunit 1
MFYIGFRDNLVLWWFCGINILGFFVDCLKPPSLNAFYFLPAAFNGLAFLA